MSLLIVILVSLVVVQVIINYYVYNKLAVLKTFKLFGVGIKQLYIGALLLAPIIIVLFVIVLLFQLIKSLFTKKTKVVKKPYTVGDDIDEFLKEFDGGKE